MVQKSARGRPRSFDTDQVLGSVRDAFWRHGYSGTSMDQLVAATGLHKPSLYGAFGDKRRLYLETLNRYLEEAREQIAAALSRPKLADSLTEFAARGILLFTRNGPNGCFMMATAVPESGGDDELKAVVRSTIESLERALARRFRRAIDDGEIPADSDPDALAMLVAAQHFEMSARARAGFSVEELQARAARNLALVRKVADLRDG